MGHTHNVHGGRSSILHSTRNNAVLGGSNALLPAFVFNKVTVTEQGPLPKKLKQRINKWNKVAGKTTNLSSSLLGNGFVYNAYAGVGLNVKLIK